MAKIFTKKCPDCDGKLVRSRGHSAGYAMYFWTKPWDKTFIKGLTGNSKVYPWLCMNCGRVFLYVDEKEQESIKREYEKKKMKI